MASFAVFRSAMFLRWIREHCCTLRSFTLLNTLASLILRYSCIWEYRAVKGRSKETPKTFTLRLHFVCVAHIPFTTTLNSVYRADSLRHNYIDLNVPYGIMIWSKIWFERLTSLLILCNQEWGGILSGQPFLQIVIAVNLKYSLN